MRKLRPAVGALVAVLVAVPVVASAAAGTYRSNSVKDPVDDVMSLSNGRTVSDPSVDIYKLVGYRYAKYFVLTVGFKHLTPATYTHRFVVFGDTYEGRTTRSTIIDLGVGSDGARPATEVIIDKYDVPRDDGSTYVLPCSGAKARPDYSTGKVTYTLPVTCFKNYEQTGAEMAVVAGRWRSSDWRSAVFDSDEPANLDVTDRDDPWTWDRSVEPVAARADHSRLLSQIRF